MLFFQELFPTRWVRSRNGINTASVTRGTVKLNTGKYGGRLKCIVFGLDDFQTYIPLFMIITFVYVQFSGCRITLVRFARTTTTVSKFVCGGNSFTLMECKDVYWTITFLASCRLLFSVIYRCLLSLRKKKLFNWYFDPISSLCKQRALEIQVTSLGRYWDIKVCIYYTPDEYWARESCRRLSVMFHDYLLFTVCR